MRRLIRCSSTLTVLIALIGLMVFPQTIWAQDANVEPNAGPSGTEFAFFAEGFAPNEQVGVWINNPDGSVSDIIDADGDVLVLYANADGRADWFVIVDGPDGFYGMVARGVTSGYEVMISFELNASAVVRPPSPPEVIANVEPNIGPPGTEFAFFAEEFAPNEQVGVWINTPDGSVEPIFDEDGEVLVLYANADGRADWFVIVSEDAQPGVYEMVARGVESGFELIIPFEISAGS